MEIDLEKEVESAVMEKLAEVWFTRLSELGYEATLTKETRLIKTPHHKYSVSAIVHCDNLLDVHRTLAAIKHVCKETNTVKKRVSFGGFIVAEVEREIKLPKYETYAELELQITIAVPPDKKVDILQATICKTVEVKHKTYDNKGSYDSYICHT